MAMTNRPDQRQDLVSRIIQLMTSGGKMPDLGTPGIGVAGAAMGGGNASANPGMADLMSWFQNGPPKPRRSVAAPPSPGGDNTAVMAQLIQSLLGAGGGIAGAAGQGGNFINKLFGGGGAGDSSQGGAQMGPPKNMMNPSLPGPMAPQGNPMGGLQGMGGGGGQAPSALAGQFGMPSQGTPGAFSMGRGGAAMGSPESTVMQTPLGAGAQMQNKGMNAALGGMMPGAEPGGLSEYQKAMLQMLMQQMKPAGNQFNNPYMKGPDWGNGISSAIDQFAMAKKMKGLGL